MTNAMPKAPSRKETLLAALRALGGEASNRDIRKLTGMDAGRVKKGMKYLRDQGFVEAVKAGVSRLRAEHMAGPAGTVSEDGTLHYTTVELARLVGDRYQVASEKQLANYVAMPTTLVEACPGAVAVEIDARGGRSSAASTHLVYIEEPASLADYASAYAVSGAYIVQIAGVAQIRMLSSAPGGIRVLEKAGAYLLSQQEAAEIIVLAKLAAY